MKIQELATEFKLQHKALNDYLKSINKEYHGYISLGKNGTFEIMCNLSLRGYGYTQWVTINHQWKAIGDESALPLIEVLELVAGAREVLEHQRGVEDEKV